MWTDPYIAKKLLNMHLDPSNDVASRSAEKIDKIVNHINISLNNMKVNLLDLGCGPGLYTEHFAKAGHTVTGIDFSENSIEHAKTSSQTQNFEIKYICQNYLEMYFENQFDVITLIYCDFGVLSVSDRKTLIAKIYKALKPGGIFIFDALNQNTIEKQSFTKTWDISSGGFWKENPYICLSENFHFEDHKATLEQHIVIDETEQFEIYRFWNHYFTEKDIRKLFIKQGFKHISAMDIQLDDGSYNDSSVTFYKIKK